MSFKLGQVFTGTYPPEAAEWCNEGQKYHIDEIDANAKGERRFKIVKNIPLEELTKE